MAHPINRFTTEAPRVELTLDGQKHFVAVTERFLPQGACTSPAITNILCRALDARLSGASQKLNFVYTRYADDLIFSSREPKPFAVAMRDLAAKIIAAGIGLYCVHRTSFSSCLIWWRLCFSVTSHNRFSRSSRC